MANYLCQHFSKIVFFFYKLWTWFFFKPHKNTIQKLKNIKAENTNIERCIVIACINIILIYILTSMPS